MEEGEPAVAGTFPHEDAAGVEVADVTLPVAPPPVSPTTQMAAADVGVPPVTPSAAQTYSRHAAFINKIARHTAALLPSVVGQKCRSKAPPPGQTPRRSRRIAGVQAEFQVG